MQLEERIAAATCLEDLVVRKLNHGRCGNESGSDNLTKGRNIKLEQNRSKRNGKRNNQS